MTPDQAKKLNDRVIVALDFDLDTDAFRLVETIRDDVSMFKIGSRMFTAYGPQLIDQLGEMGANVFLDLKYHDIPSVVGDATRRIAERFDNVFLTTVHASGGAAMINAAAEGAASRDDLSVVAVTALTSISPSETHLLGIGCALTEWAEKLGRLAIDAGADGLVCSANEAAHLREALGDAPTLVTSGIRLQGKEAGDDQARTQTPAEALNSGSSFLVIGRPIYRSEDPKAVVAAIAATF